MLNRRFLRIKVMQALYSFFQHEKANTALFEKELFKSLDKIQELYLSILALVMDIHHMALMVIDESKNKHRPNAQDLDPNLKFVNNTLLMSMVNNQDLKNQIEKRKISWQNDNDVVRRIFNLIRNGEEYKAYLELDSPGIKEDREFIVAIITEYLSENEVLISLFEEKNIHWADDTFVAFNSVIRNFEDFTGEFKMQPLLKDEKDDLEFMSVLFNKTIVYHQQFEELIGRHTQNWEVERIANMDMLLMEMALSEILYLPNVPIKASLNEYIDISKEYSTPNSKTFVNGVLDKIIAELKRDNRIVKTGRGLKEN
ncbi:transcription antitermination protein NusB [Aurantibacillus circumpalustris]|uniref:transcription antitermination protein NusB n=1 Tax=Aurantibacillus circumpalustris TaxID=3036359 RepID=UPI00295ACFAD|nr:transcription antitermination protein NusB [Aurantibacillus circumpalustris]